jgi:hypothetical protein
VDVLSKQNICEDLEKVEQRKELKEAMYAKEGNGNGGKR